MEYTICIDIAFTLLQNLTIVCYQNRKILRSGMSFSISKCFCVSYGLTDSSRAYATRKTPISRHTLFSDLGVMVFSPLGFKSNIDTVVSRAFSSWV